MAPRVGKGTSDVPRDRRGRRRKLSRPMLAATEESIPSMEYDRPRGWVRRAESHGMVDLVVRTAQEDYQAFGINFPAMKPARVRAVADSGCQAPLMGTDMLYRLGLKKKDLVRV